MRKRSWTCGDAYHSFPGKGSTPLQVRYYRSRHLRMRVTLLRNLLRSQKEAYIKNRGSSNFLFWDVFTRLPMQNYRQESKPPEIISQERLLVV